MAGSAADEFDLLMRGHVPALYRAAYRWTNDVDQAEDLVQEALTKLFPQLAQLRQIEQLRPWATRVMYRIFVDNLRRTRRSPVSYSGDEEIDVEDPTWDPEVLAEQALERDRILAAWPKLAEQHRVVLSLHEIEGYSLEEVAAMVEIPLGTAKSRLNRARQRLRGLLTEGTVTLPNSCKPTDNLVSNESGG
jgi:RNA polymerase sigma-70 factor (ECF subfamily)